MDVELVGLFRDLVRLETELWNRVDVTVQQAHGVPLAWLEIMQVVAATEGCRVLDIARALSITVGWGEQGCGQSRGCRFVPAEP